MKNYLSLTELNSALALRDLTDPAAGAHAMQLLLADVVAALERLWNIPSETHRLNPLVATADNYDRLGYSPADVTRDSRYSRHVSPTVMLRSHTSAGIPALLDSLRGEQGLYDRLHVLPGLVYRRDAVDRTHVGAPHQVDLWRLKARGLLGPADLQSMMAAVVEAVLPAAELSGGAVAVNAVHAQLYGRRPAAGRAGHAAGRQERMAGTRRVRPGGCPGPAQLRA